jgi:hypothetical protein
MMKLATAQFPFSNIGPLFEVGTASREAVIQCCVVEKHQDKPLRISNQHAGKTTPILKYCGNCPGDLTMMTLNDCRQLDV